MTTVNHMTPVNHTCQSLVTAPVNHKWRMLITHLWHLSIKPVNYGWHLSITHTWHPSITVTPLNHTHQSLTCDTCQSLVVPVDHCDTCQSHLSNIKQCLTISTIMNMYTATMSNTNTLYSVFWETGPLLTVKYVGSPLQPVQHSCGSHVTRQQQLSINTCICYLRPTYAANPQATTAAMGQTERQMDGHSTILRHLPHAMWTA